MRDARLICILAGLGALGLAPPVAAQETALFSAPDGCDITLTVQTRSCLVWNFYHCPDRHTDHFWIAKFNKEGHFSTSRLSKSGQWIAFGPPHDPERLHVLTPIHDPLDLEDLFATGLDSMDFYVRQLGQPYQQFTGYERVTGETEIDGEPLTQTTYEVVNRDWQGQVLQHRVGEGFASARHRGYFSGKEHTLVNGAETNHTDTTPVRFIYPGEDGFAGTVPLYDCDVISLLDHGRVAAG